MKNIFFVTMILAGASQAQVPSYTTIALEVERADDIVAEDLNGDSLKDLLIQGGKDLHIYYQTSQGFRSKPDQVLRLGGEVFLWTLGRLRAKDRWSIFVATSRGIQVHPFEEACFGDTPCDLIIHPNLFEGLSSQTECPLRFDFCPELDGNVLNDALLFQKDRLDVFLQDPPGDFRLIQKLKLPIERTLEMLFGAQRTVASTSSVPVLAFGDLDGDGRKDIGYYRNEAIGAYLQSSKGRFERRETLDLQKITKKRRHTYVQFELPPRVVDINGDGTLDIAMIYPSKGKVLVYFTRKDRTDFSSPDVIKQIGAGWATGIYLKDLDEDGTLDLVMGAVRKFGILEGLNVFLSGKVQLELHFYPFRENGYADEPKQILTFRIPFSFTASRESARVDLVFRPNFDGDFNGDGKRDMLVMAEQDSLHIYYGSPTEIMESSPRGKIAITPPEGTLYTKPTVTDLNGDGLSDIVLRYSLPEERKHRLEVKCSKK